MKKRRALRALVLAAVTLAGVVPSSYAFYFCREMQEAMAKPCCDHDEAIAHGEDEARIEAEVCCSKHTVALAQDVVTAPSDDRAPVVALAPASSPPALAFSPVVAVPPAPARVFYDPGPIFIRVCALLI